MNQKDSLLRGLALGLLALFLTIIWLANRTPMVPKEMAQELAAREKSFDVDGIYFGESRDEINEHGKSVYADAEKFQTRLKDATFAFGTHHLQLKTADIYFYFNKSHKLESINIWSDFDKDHLTLAKEHTRIATLFRKKYGSPKELSPYIAEHKRLVNIHRLEWIYKPKNVRIELYMNIAPKDEYRMLMIDYTPLHWVEKKSLQR